MLHKEFPESWDGEDIFSEEYEKRRPLRRAAELISQMTLYLDALLGETSVFPIHLKIINPIGVKVPIDVAKKNSIHALKVELVNKRIKEMNNIFDEKRNKISFVKRKTSLDFLFGRDKEKSQYDFW